MWSPYPGLCENFIVHWIALKISVCILMSWEIYQNSQEDEIQKGFQNDNYQTSQMDINFNIHPKERYKIWHRNFKQQNNIFATFYQMDICYKQ